MGASNTVRNYTFSSLHIRVHPVVKGSLRASFIRGMSFLSTVEGGKLPLLGELLLRLGVEGERTRDIGGGIAQHLGERENGRHRTSEAAITKED